jgi:tetratricopeptide (TPR) repeat protein
MTSRQSTIDSRQSSSRLLRFVSGLATLLALVSCATAPRVTGRDRFPLDPREDLAGPFPSGVEKGWKALLEGDAVRAETAFETARGEKPRQAGDIGRVEATVLAGRPKAALPLCEELLSAGEPTPALLVACGEARARSGDSAGGYALYRRALARVTGRPGLKVREEELRAAASEQLVDAGRKAAAEKKWKEARAELARALEITPEDPAPHAAAGDVEAAAGEKQKAFRRYREALDLGSKDPAVAEKAGDLALEVGEHGLAVSLFDALAKDNSRFAPRAEEARLTFRVANWPATEREAARSPRLTRAGAATLVWWMYPEIREARVVNGVIASDAVSRKDSRAVTRAVALGLLDVDRETHRANPDAHMTAAATARFLLRLLVVVTPVTRELPCLGETRRPPRGAAQAIEAAQGCGLLPENNSPLVSGPVFTRALDRIRAVASSGGEAADE